MTIAELEAVESIKKLKARYLRFMDQREWDRWADLFAENATIETRIVDQEIVFKWNGREEIVELNRAANMDSKSIHHCHTPDIEITSETTATGSWALFDLYFKPYGRAEAYGYYEDHYVKIDGCWKIQSIKLALERAPA